jgi:hypothetical protein
MPVGAQPPEVSRDRWQSAVVRACVVVPLAWDATGSVRDRPYRMRTGGRLSTGPEVTARNHARRRHVLGMDILLATLALTLPSPDPGTWPLRPRPEVVHGFELPAKPWLPGHRGVDLAGTPGQPVLAATAGTITYAGPLAGRGVITVAAGPRRTTYEPVVPTVTVGTAVTAGSVIGHLSAAGSHCRPRTCLHWGLVQGRQYLNPLTLIPNRPVRLLPLSTASPPPDAQLLTSPPPRAQLPASPAPGAEPARPSPRAEAATSPTIDRTAVAIVGATAALTTAGGLLIRRH